jgi:hypothetical protein
MMPGTIPLVFSSLWTLALWIGHWNFNSAAIGYRGTGGRYCKATVMAIGILYRRMRFLIAYYQHVGWNDLVAHLHQ